MDEGITESKREGNGIATAQDFRKLAEMRAREEFETPQHVTLPGSGLAVLVRRPKMMYFVLTGSPLPQSLAARQAGETAPNWTPDEAREVAARMTRLMQASLVQPRLSLDPGPEEISPNWLLPDDVTFLFHYLVGEVLAGGQDLGRFPGNPPASAAPGTAGGDLALPPQPVAARDEHGFSS